MKFQRNSCDKTASVATVYTNSYTNFRNKNLLCIKVQEHDIFDLSPFLSETLLISEILNTVKVNDYFWVHIWY